MSTLPVPLFHRDPRIVIRLKTLQTWKGKKLDIRRKDLFVKGKQNFSGGPGSAHNGWLHFMCICWLRFMSRMPHYLAMILKTYLWLHFISNFVNIYLSYIAYTFQYTSIKYLQKTFTDSCLNTITTSWMKYWLSSPM